MGLDQEAGSWPAPGSSGGWELVRDRWRNANLIRSAAAIIGFVPLLILQGGNDVPWSRRLDRDLEPGLDGLEDRQGVLTGSNPHPNLLAAVLTGDRP